MGLEHHLAHLHLALLDGVHDVLVGAGVRDGVADADAGGGGEDWGEVG